MSWVMNRTTARNLLQAERRRLEELFVVVSTQGRDEGEMPVVGSELSSNDQHPADLATDTFERARDVSIAQRVEAELTDVARALQRIDEGTYGTCEACGRKVDEARLQVLPATRFCVEDQERAEREAS
jgi:RNA polymerase-binding transcription factor DksA